MPAAPEAWDAKMAEIMEGLLNASSEWEAKKFEAQLKDAEAGRANAMKIAKLQSETSRYGMDLARKTALDQLKENARQFDRRHALDIATTATEYLSTPDRYFQATDFLSMTNSVAGGQAQRPYAYGTAPTPKTMQDFNALYTGGGSPDGDAARVPTGGAGVYGSSGRASSGGTAAPRSTTDSGSDPRVAAVQGIFKNIAPSEGGGLDDLDYAALDAARAIFQSNLRPKDLAQMRPGQAAMLGSAGQRLGYYVPDWLKQQERNAIGQQSVRRA